MAKLELTQIIFDELVDLLIRNETQKFINYFNNGCVNINFKHKFTKNDGYLVEGTILFVAGHYRNMEGMKCLIKNGASFNIKIKVSYSKEYNLSIFNELCATLQHNNKYNLRKQYNLDDYTFMKFCLENGANPNIKIENYLSSFQIILSNTKEDIIELFINYDADVRDIYNDKYVLQTLCENTQFEIESKLALINKIKRSYTNDELYNLSKKILESDLPDKYDIAKELDTIESNGKSAAKIKIA